VFEEVVGSKYKSSLIKTLVRTNPHDFLTMFNNAVITSKQTLEKFFLRGAHRRTERKLNTALR
jgi:hypothetical protein